MRRATMRTFVYVDGFNLYYGALKGTPWKWLDLPALFAKVLQPHHDIPTVKYFSARVSGTPADPSKPQRQDVYLRALRCYRREVEVYFWHFLSHKVRVPITQPAGSERTAEVIRTEEKGSDVSVSPSICSTTAGSTRTIARWWSATTATSPRRCTWSGSITASGSAW